MIIEYTYSIKLNHIQYKISSTVFSFLEAPIVCIKCILSDSMNLSSLSLNLLFDHCLIIYKSFFGVSYGNRRALSEYL